MTVCQYFLQGKCNFGDRCRNEHPRNQPSAFGQSTSQSILNQGRGSGGGFSAFGGGGQNVFSQQSAFSALASDKTTNKTRITEDFLQRTLKNRPIWEYSAFGPDPNQPSIITGTDISPEESRIEFLLAQNNGSLASYQQKYAALSNEMNQKINDIKARPADALRFWNTQIDQANANSSGFNNNSNHNAQGAFGQTTKTSAFGQSSFSQQPKSAFGQALSGSAFGNMNEQKNAFGQGSNSSFNQGSSSAFGQGTSSAFGQGTSSAFGQGTSSVFGQGTSSAFGQGTSSAFGQGTNSAFGQQTLGTNGFGGNPTQGFNSTSSAFGQAMPQNSAFGNNTSVFGGSSTFGGGGFATTNTPSTQQQISFGNTPDEIKAITGPDRELSRDELDQFNAPKFKMGMIPEVPPLPEMC